MDIERYISFESLQYLNYNKNRIVERVPFSEKNNDKVEFRDESGVISEIEGEDTLLDIALDDFFLRKISLDILFVDDGIKYILGDFTYFLIDKKPGAEAFMILNGKEKSLGRMYFLKDLQFAFETISAFKIMTTFNEKNKI